MADIEVHTKKQLFAALRGAAWPTYEEAKKHPLTIQFKTTRMTFKEGIHERRAEEIIRGSRAKGDGG